MRFLINLLILLTRCSAKLDYGFNPSTATGKMDTNDNEKK